MKSMTHLFKDELNDIKIALDYLEVIVDISGGKRFIGADGDIVKKKKGKAGDRDKSQELPDEAINERDCILSVSC